MKIKEKINLNNILNIIILIALLFTNIYAGLLVGSYLKNNVQIINMLLNIIAIISILYNSIIKKRFKINRLDILVFILSLSSIIPLIFKTYASVQDTIEYALWYLSVANIYIIAKNIIYINKKYKNVIIYGTIIISILLILIGIDDITFNYLAELKNKLGNIIRYTETNTRLESTFRYPNSFASCICFAMFLTIGKAISTKNKIEKPVLEAIVFIQLSAIWLSGSRLTIIIFLIMLLIYMILLRKKKENLSIIKIISVNIILAIIYSTFYLEAIENEDWIFAWKSLFIIFIVSILIHIILNYILNIIYKIKTKNIVITAFLIGSILVFTFIVLLQIDTPLKVENIQGTDNVITRRIYNIEPNKEYNLKFDIDIYQSEDTYCIYEILVKQYDKYEKSIKQDRIRFENNNIGNELITIQTDPNTTNLRISFRTKEQTDKVMMRINSLEINGKKHILEYKYLPTKLISRFGTEVFETKSTWERFTFISDGLKVAKENILFGTGGNGWMYKYKDVQTYKYTSRDVHSHPIQMLIQYGIIGFMAYVGIILILCLNVKKVFKDNKDIINITILCAVINIILHSFLDMDMSYFYNLITTFMYLGIISYEYNDNKEKENNNTIFFIVIEIILILTLILNTKILIAEKLYEKVENIYNIDERTIKIDKMVKLNPYKYEYRKMQLDCLIELKYYRKLEEEIDNKIMAQIIDDIEFFIENDVELYDSDNYTVLIECYAQTINKENAVENINKIRNIFKLGEERKNISLNEEDIYERLLPIIKEKIDCNKEEINKFYQELLRRKIIRTNN